MKEGKKGRYIDKHINKRPFNRKLSTNCCYYPTDGRHDAILPDEDVSPSHRTTTIIENL